MMLASLAPLSLALLYTSPAQAAPADPTVMLWTEAAPVWQSRNDVGIPADDGTRFSLTELGTGPALAGRIYGQLTLWERHEIRALWAPFTLRQEGTYATDLSFMGATYAADTELESLYRFNSYRLTYRWAVLERDRTSLKVGFTGKVRDAAIGLTQGEISETRTNLGFVPLLHVAFEHEFTDEVGIVFDADGLWSPYGRAEDVALLATFTLHPSVRGLVGYRTVEGGAEDGGNVHTFAWLHFASLGLQIGAW